MTAYCQSRRTESGGLHNNSSATFITCHTRLSSTIQCFSHFSFSLTLLHIAIINVDNFTSPSTWFSKSPREWWRHSLHDEDMIPQSLPNQTTPLFVVNTRTLVAKIIYGAFKGAVYTKLKFVNHKPPFFPNLFKLLFFCWTQTQKEFKSL